VGDVRISTPAQSSGQDPDGQCIDDLDRPHVAQAAVVLIAPVPCLRMPQSPPAKPEVAVPGPGEPGEALPLRHHHPQTGGLKAERGQLQDQGFSYGAVIMLTARRTSTRKVYDARWNTFTSWCHTRGTDPTSASVNLIIDFLTSLVKNEAINTVRGYITAISSRHDPIDGLPISLHPAVTLWNKGLVRLSSALSRAHRSSHSTWPQTSTLPGKPPS
jgi:hypothetical protein